MTDSIEGAPAAVSVRPALEQFILHLSDTHLVSSGGLLHGTVDADRHLRELFAGLAESSARPRAIVFTGDLTDTGTPDAYARLREIVEPAARALDAQVIWVMGNHDDRAAFRTALLDEAGAADGPVDRVFDVDGLRIIAIDSTVPGSHHGEITAAQRDWLAEHLQTPAPGGTLLAMHHPPIPSPLELASMIELRDQHLLAEVVAGTDVRGILAGHLHYSTHSTFAGVPVSVAAATCYTQDLLTEQPGARGQDGGQSYNLVHVYDDRVLHSVVPLGQFPTTYEITPDTLQQRLATPRPPTTAR